MRIAGPLIAAALLMASAAPVQALSIGPPDCHALDRAVRESPTFAVVRLEWAGETRREGAQHVTPLRVVVREVVKGRDIRRDQVLAWDDRVDEASLELFSMDRPHYQAGVEHLAVIDAAGRVDLWPPVGFYATNLRACYRRAMVSRAGRSG